MPKKSQVQTLLANDLTPSTGDAIADITHALEPFDQATQRRLLKAACVMCALDADIEISAN